MARNEMVRARYFRWMTNLVCGDGYGGRSSWRKLFRLLYDTQFIYILDMDSNRANDGVDLRYRFAYESGMDEQEAKQFLDDRPCTVLEMMVALACRCEEQIMYDPDNGNRTGKWFFGMIHSLGLSDMDDDGFMREPAADILHRFMRREYDYYGRGGLFTLQHPKTDMRDMEIWYQLMGFLGETER